MLCVEDVAKWLHHCRKMLSLSFTETHHLLVTNWRQRAGAGVSKAMAVSAQQQARYARDRSASRSREPWE